jgi:hypothetical protein
MITVKRKVHVARQTKGRVALVEASPAHEAADPGRVPRISRLMALAIHLDRLLREGAVADISELARLAHVTQPRMTQIMNLNHLAPDIQEDLLILPRVTRARDQVFERTIRPITRKLNWRQQRRSWGNTGLSNRRSASSPSQEADTPREVPWFG